MLKELRNELAAAESAGAVGDHDNHTAELVERLQSQEDVARACRAAVPRVESVTGLNQEIGVVETAEGAKAWVGVAQGVIDKVRKQRIRSVKTEKGGESRVGVF